MSHTGRRCLIVALTLLGFGSAAMVRGAEAEKILAIPANGGRIEHLAFSPDGLWLATGGVGVASFEIRILQIKTGQPALTLKTKAAIRGLAFSPDGVRLAAEVDGTGGGLGGGARDLVVWDLATAKESYTLTGVHSNDAWCFQPDGKQLATGNSDASITIWNAASGDEVVSYKPEGAKAQVGNLHFLAQAKQIIGSDVNTTIVSAWDAANGKLLNKLDVGGKVGVSVPSADLRRLAVGAGGVPMRVWDLSTGRAVTEVTLNSSNPTFSPNGRLLAGNKSPVRVWQVPGGKELLQIKDSAPSKLYFSPDSSLLAGTLLGEGAIVWKVAAPDPAFRPIETPLALPATLAPPKVEKVGQQPVVPRVSVVKQPMILRGHAEPAADSRPDRKHLIRDLALSPDQTRLASVNGTGDVLLWELKSGQSVTLAAETGAWRVMFTPNGESIMAGNDRRVSLWDVKTGAGLASFGQGGSESSRWYAAADGSAVAIIESPGNGVQRYRFFATATRAELFSFDLKTSIGDVALSNRASMAAFISEKDIRLIDLTGKKELDPIRGVSVTPERLIFHPDGKQLIVASWYDRELQLWDVSRTPAALVAREKPLGSSYGGATQCFFTLGGETLVLADDSSGSVRLWDVATRKMRDPIPGISRPVELAADGKTLVGLKGNAGTTFVIDTASLKAKTTIEATLSGDRKQTEWGTSGAYAVADDGTFAAVGMKSGLIEVRPLVGDATEVEVATLSSPLAEAARGTQYSRASTLRFSGDGNYVLWSRQSWTAIASRRSGKFWFPLVASKLTQSPLALNSHFFQGDRNLAALGKDQTEIWNYPLGAERPTPVFNRTEFYSFAISPDQKQVAAIIKPPSKTLQVVLLDPNTAKPIGEPLWKEPPGSDHRQARYAFSADNRRLALGLNREVRVWDLETRKEWTLDVDGDALFLNDRGTTLTVVPGGTTIEVYDIETSQRKAALDPARHHTGEVYAVAFSPVANVFASGGKNGEVLLRDMGTGDIVRRLSGHTGTVEAAAFSLDGAFLSTAALTNQIAGSTDLRDLEIKVWKIDPNAKTPTAPSGEAPTTPKPNNAAPGAPREIAAFPLKVGVGYRGLTVQFSPDNSLLVVDGFVFDVAQKKVRWTLENVQRFDFGQPYRFSPDNAWLVYKDDAGSRKTVSVDLKTGKAQMTDDKFSTSDAAFPPAGGVLAVATHSPTGNAMTTALMLLDPATLAERGPKIEARGGWVDALAYSFDGSLLAVASGHVQGYRLTLVDSATLAVKETLVDIFKDQWNDQMKMRRLAFSPDGQTLAVWGGAEKFQLWGLKNKQVLRSSKTSPVLAGPPLSFAGSRGLLLGVDPYRLYDIQTDVARPLADPSKAHPGRLNPHGHARSADARVLATGDQRGKLIVWDLVRGTSTPPVNAHEDEIVFVALSADGRMLATGGKDDLVKVWSVE